MSAKREKVFKVTTEIPVSRSIAGITEMLAGAKAKSINQDYASDGSIASIRFILPVPGGDCLYELPARVEPVFQLLRRQRPAQSRKSDADLRLQAARVAWRQTYAWVEAQLAMIQSGMVKPEEVFLPYWTNQEGVTMFRAWESRRLLEAPKSQNA